MPQSKVPRRFAGIRLAIALLSLLTMAACGTVPASVMPAKSDDASRAQIIDTFGKLPLRFEANPGQTDEQVKFLARGTGHTLFLTPTEAVMVFTKREQTAKSRLQGARLRPEEAVHVTRTVLRMTFVGANPEPRVVGAEELPDKANYFIGNDPAKWRTNVPTYARVQYTDVYPGIDLIYYGSQRRLEYDFVVRPGADPRTIALGFQGADKLEVDPQGDLVLHTGAGEIRQRKPVIYQEIGGVRREIAGGYVLKGESRVGFHVAVYDTSRPLVIDPALVYSTYLGGSADDAGVGIAVDAAGNAYVTGSTASANFPTTAGAFQTTLGGGGVGFDAFVTKLNSTGSALLYSTYLGGSNNDDSGVGIAVDGAGNAYVTGSAFSTDFPTTPGAFQSSFGGVRDAFVTKLNPTGSTLVYSTYLGGTGDDGGVSIAVDTAGSAYVSGFAQAGFPTTTAAFQPGFGGGPYDAFVTKVDPMGSALVYSTYLGGSGDDEANGLIIDAAGSAYVSGFAQAGFPTTTAAFQPGFGGGPYDAFVTKLGSTGSALVYSTYLGGSGDDEVFGGLAVDASGNAYVTGFTTSANFPTTPGAFQTTFGGAGPLGFGDAFVTKLNSTGSMPVFSTYLGGSGDDFGAGIAVDGNGNAYIAGSTASTNFPTTPGAFQTTFGGSGPLGLGDAFVTKLNPTGSALIYSTYLGGSGDDFASRIAVDVLPNPSAYVTGNTASTNFPTTAGAFQTTLGGVGPFGAGDAFVAKIAQVANLSITKTDSPDPIAVGHNLTYTMTVTNNGPDAATGAVVTDPLPASAAFISASPQCVYTQSSHTVTCSLGTLANGSTATVSVVVRPVQGGTITDTASVMGNEMDPDTSNNTATASTTVNGPPNQPPACNSLPSQGRPPICP